MSLEIEKSVKSFKCPTYPDPQHVLNLIRQLGFSWLAGCDGCNCGHLSLTNITVQVSCLKAGATIDVFSASMDRPNQKDMEAIAEEVLNQTYSDDEEGREYKSRFKVTVGNGSICYSS